MSQVRVYGRENLPRQASLFLPNRIDEATREALEAELGGAAKVMYVVEEELQPDPGIMEKVGAERIVKFRFRTSKSRELRELLMEHLAAGRHIVFMPGRPAQVMGCLSDVPKPFLMQLGALHISPVPVFTGFYRKSIWSACPTAPVARLR